jgi:hypothetical protein
MHDAYPDMHKEVTIFRGTDQAAGRMAGMGRQSHLCERFLDRIGALEISAARYHLSSTSLRRRLRCGYCR